MDLIILVSLIAPSDRDMCYGIDCVELQPLLLFRACLIKLVVIGHVLHISKIRKFKYSCCYRLLLGASSPCVDD